MNNQSSSFLSFISLLKNPFFFISWLALMFVSYFYFDQAVAIFMHGLQGTQFVAIANIISKFGLGFPYIILFVGLYLLARFALSNIQLQKAAFYLLLSILTSSIVCNILKIFLGRSRPSELFKNDIYGFYLLQLHSPMWSFPSGHATVVAAIATALSFLQPRLWWLFVSIAGIICVSRIVVAAHFISDVMAGFYLGSIIVIFMTERLQQRMRLIIPANNFDMAA